eukprot:14984776-Alexandrium_andersonii.AAC.1
MVRHARLRRSVRSCSPWPSQCPSNLQHSPTSGGESCRAHRGSRGTSAGSSRGPRLRPLGPS